MTIEEIIKALNEIKECPIALKAWYIVALEMAIKAIEQEPKSPCDVCMYNPPSSTDGKPCIMCPATGRSK